jgi:hypothetical protein
MKTPRKNRGGRIKEVRNILRLYPDGLTTQELQEKTQTDRSHISRILNSMPDAYIDRWIAVNGKRWVAAVWCVVVAPENCPRPVFKPKETKK